MIADVPASTLLYAIATDSFDWIVITLLVFGFVFWLRRSSVPTLFPLLVAGLITCGLGIIIGKWSVSGSSGFFFTLWVPYLLFITTMLIIQLRNREIHSQLLWRPISSTILSIVIFVIMVSRIFSAKNLPPIFLANRISVFFICFMLLACIDPSQFLPPIVFRKTARFCLLLALGIFLLRGSFWTYTAFNAASKGPVGSYIPRGILFAEHWADSWHFQHLDKIIQDHWLYRIQSSQ